MAKLGIVLGNNWISSLTKIFTKSRAYHTFWQTEDYIYDMWLLRRRQPKGTYDGKEVIWHDFPDVTQSYLEFMLTYDTQEYGFKDYLLFSTRWFFHLIGRPTPNADGQICSEMCNNDLIRCGYATPWWNKEEVPSPGDFERWISEDNTKYKQREQSWH
jgi:hypothetical protein